MMPRFSATAKKELTHEISVRESAHTMVLFLCSGSDSATWGKTQLSPNFSCTGVRALLCQGIALGQTGSVPQGQRGPVANESRIERVSIELSE